MIEIIAEGLQQLTLDQIQECLEVLGQLVEAGHENFASSIEAHCDFTESDKE